MRERRISYRVWREPEAIGIAAIVLALLLVLTCTGCRANSPGVRVAVGFMGATVSVQIGGGDLAPRATVESLPPAPPVAKPVPPVDEGPKDEEEGPGKEGPA